MSYLFADLSFSPLICWSVFAFCTLFSSFLSLLSPSPSPSLSLSLFFLAQFARRLGATGFPEPTPGKPKSPEIVQQEMEMMDNNGC